ncbi:unnamed protein product [Linum trigynum]|uniref:Secreted protein n=1 Tax=Linum trigynum TaxID=586398 RepID=A0AAV2FTM1_9ROSI
MVTIANQISMVDRLPSIRWLMLAIGTAMVPRKPMETTTKMTLGSFCWEMPLKADATIGEGRCSDGVIEQRRKGERRCMSSCRQRQSSCRSSFSPSPTAVSRVDACFF